MITNEQVQAAYAERHQAFIDHAENRYALADYAAMLAMKYEQQEAKRKTGHYVDPITGRPIKEEDKPEPEAPKAIKLTLEGREAAARGETKFKVFCYWNLHKHCWSIKALSGYAKGKVIAHAHTVSIAYPYAQVSEAGRQRVIREQKKNVHAGLVGLLDLDRLPEVPPFFADCTEGERITYNPYKAPTFTYKATGEVYTDSMSAKLTTCDSRAEVWVYHLIP